MARTESFEEELAGLKKGIAEEADVVEKTRLQKREEFLRLFAALKQRQMVLNESSENFIIASMLKKVCSVFFEGKEEPDVYFSFNQEIDLEKMRRGLVAPVIKHRLVWGRVSDCGTSGKMLWVEVGENKNVKVVITRPEMAPSDIVLQFDFHQPDSEYGLQKTILYILSNPDVCHWHRSDDTSY